MKLVFIFLRRSFGFYSLGIYVVIFGIFVSYSRPPAPSHRRWQLPIFRTLYPIKFSLPAVAIFSHNFLKFKIFFRKNFLYRNFHDEGYLRGISNSWYGNELICEDGNIGVCDLESCFSKEEINDDEVFEELAKTDYNLAITAFYDSMNCFENSIASIVGSKLVEGFKEGYNNKEYKTLDINNIKEQIKRFIKNKEKIIKDD
jgi:hypothetical protein